MLAIFALLVITRVNDFLFHTELLTCICRRMNLIHVCHGHYTLQPVSQSQQHIQSVHPVEEVGLHLQWSSKRLTASATRVARGHVSGSAHPALLWVLA